MDIIFTSGNNVDKINTRDFNEMIDVYNAVLDVIQNVWDTKSRKSHNTLFITDGTTTVRIGTNINGGGNLVEWWNNDTKVGGTIYDGKIMCGTAWGNLTSFIVNFFGLDDFDVINMAEFTDFENDAMCELNDTIDTISNGIRDIENKIEKEIEYGTWSDSVLIGGYAQNTFDLLIALKIAVYDFLKKMSDYTKCDFVMADAYGALTFTTSHMSFLVDDSMDIEGEFFHWLHDMFKNCENGTDMADTLYHYIAVA